MEKRKLLLVAVSVGVFLVIVLSAAILIFTPSGGGSILAARAVLPETISRPAGSATSANPRASASTGAAAAIQTPGEIQGLVIPPSVTVEPSGQPSSTSAGQGSQAIQENNVYVNGTSGSSPPAAGTANVVISVPKPATPGIPIPENRTSSPVVSSAGSAGSTRQGTTASAPVAAAPVPAVKPESTVSQTPAAPARSASSSPARPATSSPAAASPATAAPAVSATARSTAISSATGVSRVTRDYWIQTGAFSALIRAEDAKESLAAKGLSSIIDNREVDGKIWYRVRVGPYTSENEAGYWLALVQAIDGFGESQIRSTQRE